MNTIRQAGEELRKKRLIMDYHFGHSNEQQLRVIAEGLVSKLNERYGSLIDPEAKMEVLMTLGDSTEESSVCIIAITKPITQEQSTEITGFVAQCASTYKQ